MRPPIILLRILRTRSILYFCCVHCRSLFFVLLFFYVVDFLHVVCCVGSIIPTYLSVELYVSFISGTCRYNVFFLCFSRFFKKGKGGLIVSFLVEGVGFFFFQFYLQVNQLMGTRGTVVDGIMCKDKVASRL